MTQKMTRLTLAKVVAAAAALACGGAFAQAKAPEPDYTLGFNVGATTDYRYRGISQSRLRPAVSGGFDFSHKNGFYLGAWGSTIKWIKDGGGDASVELDFYGGYKGSVGDVGYDVGLLHYNYPSHKLGVSPNTTELYGALTFGVVTAKYSHSTSNLFGFAKSKGSGYFDLSGTVDLGGGWTVVPHLGYQSVSKNSAASYTDYSVTANKDMGNGLTLSAGLVGTDTKVYVSPAGKNLGKNAVVLGAKFSF
jgi:uncharacterized protein (TIGR02001 family)